LLGLALDEVRELCLVNTTVARGLYFALQAIRREPLAAALSDVRRTERMSLDELHHVQATRQLEQLSFALERVPHYRRTLAPLRTAIVSARDWADVHVIMGQIAILEKASVTTNPADFTADHADEIDTYADKTSGSSGTPVIFPCDQRAWAYRHALTHRCMELFGVQIGEPYALFFGLHWSKRKQLQVAARDRVLNRVRVSAYEIGPERFDAQLAAIRRKRPTHFQGYPSAVYDFCVLAQDRGADLGGLKLKAVFLTSEPLRAHQRQLIEAVTQSRCVNMYGSAEGGVIALECPAGGLHTTPEATWLETRDTATHTGEVVVTDMMLRAFPMIRYALGDEIVLGQSSCACGRAQPLLASIEGRAGEPITLPNGRRINGNLPSYIFKPLATLGVIRRYRFVQRERDLELFLVVSTKFQRSHLQLVKQETHRAFGDDLELKISVVTELPHLANAKHRDYVLVT
jgi:phenylacetate-CoA ligase